MSNFPSYPTRSFSETQKFFVLEPNTQTPSFVSGADLVNYLTPSQNYVYSESTRTTAQATDYPVGALIETAGATSAGDNFAAVYLVVASGEGDFPMDNGNDLLVIKGDEFLREQLISSDAGEGSDLIAHTGTSDTVTEALDKRTIYKNTVAEIEALSLDAGVNVYLTQDGRAGEGVIKSGTPPADTTNAIYITLANGNYWERLEYSKTFSMRLAGATGDGVASDQSVLDNLASLLTANVITGIDFDAGYTFLLDGETDIDLAEIFTDVSDFEISGHGKILATGLNNTITIRNGWHPKIDLRFEGGGDDWDTSTAVQVIGCYHPKVNVVGSQYAGTLLKIENGLSSGSGGNGRFESERIVAVNCGRAVYAKPSTGSTSQNGFGYIKFLWDANSKVRSSFESTQDISIGFCNVGLGLTSSSESGIKFDGANSVSINMLFIGEVTPPSDAPTQRQFACDFNNGSNVKIGHFFHIVESGASTVTTATMRINSVDGLSIDNAYVTSAKGRVFTFADTAAGNDLKDIHIKAIVKDSATEVVYFDSTANASNNINIDLSHKNCAQDGTHVSNASQVTTTEINLKTTGESASAASDLLTNAAGNKVNMLSGTTLTSGSSIAFPVSKFEGHEIEEIAGIAGIGAGAFSDVSFSKSYFKASAEVYQEDSTGGPLDLVQYNYTGGLITGARVRNRGGALSGTWRIRVYGASSE